MEQKVLEEFLTTRTKAWQDSTLALTGRSMRTSNFTFEIFWASYRRARIYTATILTGATRSTDVMSFTAHLIVLGIE